MDNLINAIDKIVEGQVFKIVISNKKDKENKYNKININFKESKNKKKTKNKRVFMWAALLHDLGKLTTTKVRKGKITAYGHDLQGEILSRQFLHQLTDDEAFIDDVCILVKHHMQPLFYDKKLPFFKDKEIIEDSDYEEISLLSMADRLGRANLCEEKIKMEEKRINNFKSFFVDKYK